MDILFFAQGDYIVYIEELLAPFIKILRINNDLGTQVAIALLICATRRSKDVLFLLQTTN